MKDSKLAFKFVIGILIAISSSLAHGQMKGHLDGVKVINGKTIIFGWACVVGSSRQVSVHLYGGTSTNNRSIIGGTTANRKSEDGVRRACKSKGNHRFEYVLSSSKLNQFKGKKVWAFGIRPNKSLIGSGSKSIPIPAVRSIAVKKISESQAKSERGDFDHERKADFNRDGVLDIVRCQGTPRKTKNGHTRFHHEFEKNVRVQIINGKNGKELYGYSFEGFKRAPNHTRRIINTSCEIAYLEDGYPSVVIGSHFENYYADNKNAPKYRKAPQRIILNKRSSLQGMVLKHGNINFDSVTKDLRCKSFDHHRIGNGAYCFFASYPTFEDRKRPAGVTFTSLVRLRRSGSSVVLNDITKKTGLIWDGVRGTHVAKYPLKHNGPHYGKRRENANVISGDFMDHNDDGLYDLFVVGQHMSFYRFNMKLDSSIDVGFKFTKSVLTAPSVHGGPSEYNRVRSFPSQFKKNCVYVSGEGRSIAGSLNYVNDHIRCYDNKKWVKIDMPNSFSSNSWNAQFIEGSRGKVIARTKKRLKSSYEQGFTYFEID